MLENDKLMEESELIMVREQQKARKRTKVRVCSGNANGLFDCGDFMMGRSGFPLHLLDL